MCITRLGQKSDYVFPVPGGGGVGGGSGADSASTLLTSRIVYVCFTKRRRTGRSGITGPQQTSRNSQIIIFYT